MKALSLLLAAIGLSGCVAVPVVEAPGVYVAPPAVYIGPPVRSYYHYGYRSDYYGYRGDYRYRRR